MGEMTRKMRKGLWSPDEDEKLSRCIAMYMTGSWSDIARKAGLERCGKSCRRRWMNHLRPDLKRGRFTPAEVSRVVELHKALGNRWSEIAGHLVGRTDNDVKNLWNTQIKRRLKLQGLQSSDAHAKVDSQDDEAISGRDGDDDTCTHKMDDEDGEKMVPVIPAAPRSSSSLKSCASDQFHEEYEDTLTKLIKPNKPASAFTFPFSSPPMFCADPQEENQNNVPIVDASDAASMFSSFPLMGRPNANAHINASISNAVVQKRTSSRNHIPHALSSSNLRKLETSRPAMKTRAVYMEFPHLSDGDTAMGVDVSSTVQKECNLQKVQDQQTCMQVVAVEGVAPWNTSDVYSDRVTNIGRESCAMETAMPGTLAGSYCRLPMYHEGASCSSTESSTSTCSSTCIDSRVSPLPQFGSPCKLRAAALMNVPEGCSRDNWHNALMYNDGEMQYDQQLLDARNSESSDDHIGSWWSSLEVPNFELPNIDDPNCWQPLDINFI